MRKNILKFSTFLFGVFFLSIVVMIAAGLFLEFGGLLFKSHS